VLDVWQYPIHQLAVDSHPKQNLTQMLDIMIK